MSFIDSVFNAQTIMAVIVFLIGASLEAFLEDRLTKKFRDNPPFQWFWQHFFGPALRALLIALFVMLCYPALFGLTYAPELGDLLTGDQSRFNLLLGALFVLTLAAQFVPVLQDHPELILPLQGVVATAIVYSWLTKDIGIIPAYPWPGLFALGTMLLIAIAGKVLARDLGVTLGESLDRRLGTNGFHELIAHLTLLLVQVPIILIYGYALGQQIAI